MLQIVAALIKTNDEIGKTMKLNSLDVEDELAQCQEFAILVGTYIETLKDDHTCLVKLLEDYCENIYQMSVVFSDKILCKKLYKKIRKQLISLYNSIQFDMPKDRMEVVFLPYKASMWDSLESVWQAAEADENTDAYVIPIPYYDKNTDGSMREEHYEGNLYPDYVPVTKYDEYNFEERNPDLVFIHNPYDDRNYVTSVHPFFYSKNLKRYTSQLVYIPYFILNEIKPDNQVAVDGMKHFCMAPAVFNADKVIVQSEDMRQIYIDVLTEASGDTKEVRKYWEKKILGLGSPKVDKVINTSKEDLRLPDKWLENIQKPDGTWKKVIFYDTSISALLENNEKLLGKMKSVFETFKKERQEVALLWRPHPLIETTLISMRPQLWEQYKMIRDAYINEGWGIYDDSADMSRAVALGDGYYGDEGCSIMQLYKAIGKPVMVQDVNRIGET